MTDPLLLATGAVSIAAAALAHFVARAKGRGSFWWTFAAAALLGLPLIPLLLLPKARRG